LANHYHFKDSDRNPTASKFHWLRIKLLITADSNILQNPWIKLGESFSWAY